VGPRRACPSVCRLSAGVSTITRCCVPPARWNRFNLGPSAGRRFKMTEEELPAFAGKHKQCDGSGEPSYGNCFSAGALDSLLMSAHKNALQGGAGTLQG